MHAAPVREGEPMQLSAAPSIQILVRIHAPCIVGTEHKLCCGSFSITLLVQGMDYFVTHVRRGGKCLTKHHASAVANKRTNPDFRFQQLLLCGLSTQAPPVSRKPHKSSNKSLASVDRSNKATLPRTALCLNKVVYNRFSPADISFIQDTRQHFR
jgi:hypothetical protein